MRRERTNTEQDRGNGGRMRRRISPSMAVALAALFFSLTGVGFAASRWIITSKRQIAPWVRASLHGAQGPRGFMGPQGAVGPVGPQGSTARTTTTAVATTKTVPAGQFATVVAPCSAPPTGGGFKLVSPVTVLASEPSGNVWLIDVQNSSEEPAQVTAWAVCPS